MRLYIKYFSYLTTLFLLTVVNKLSAQEYEIQLVNKAPLYATASLLQDYDDDGDLDIIITRRKSTNDKFPSSVEWLENDGTGQFPRNTLFQNLSFPVDVDLGDFDLDGNMDYVVSDRYVSISSGALTLFQKQNDGSYSKLFIEDSIRTDQSAVADFNKDGNLDIVAVGFNRAVVSIYWNEGNLNFNKQEITDTVVQVELVEVNDIDNDGDEDILYGGGGLDGLKLLFNNGSGIFDSSRTLFLNNNQYSNAKRGLTITDLDNDGVKDILTFSGVGFGGLYFFDGSNNYNSSLIDIDGIDLGGDIVVADFDGNGLNDIIRQNIGDDYLSILYQESSMSFVREFLELNWDNRDPGQMSIGDLDGDGDVDLVFPENGNVDGDLSWFENIDGNLYRHYLYNEIEAVRFAQIADMDNDSDLDIVVTAGDDGIKTEEDEIVWYENRGETTFIEHRIDDDISFPADLKLGDLDDDGILDVIVTAHDDSSLIWYKKSGPGWTKIVVDENFYQPLGCAVADLNSDEQLDIVVCSSSEDKVFWYMNDGVGIFSRNIVDDNLIAPQSVEIVDLNDDNESDIVVVTADTNNTVVIYINDGNENFTRTTIANNQKGIALEIGDWDRNDTPDILVGFDKGSSSGSAKRDLAVFLNNGQGNFSDSTLIVLEERTNVIKLADVDNDNDLDIIFGSGTAGIFPLRLALNTNGSIDSIMDISDRAVRVYGIDAADINDDGILDIVASDQVNSTNNLQLFIGSIGTDVTKDVNTIPSFFSLYQNYPNPFNPSTKIKYSISSIETTQRNVFTKLVVYDVLGRVVATLVNEQQKVGYYEIDFNASHLTSGVYFYKIQIHTGNRTTGELFRETKKMLLLR